MKPEVEQSPWEVEKVVCHPEYDPSKHPDRATAAGTRVLVQCGSYGAGTILRPAPDGFHGREPHRVWWVRLDDGRELQVEQCLIQLEYMFKREYEVLG